MAPMTRSGGSSFASNRGSFLDVQATQEASWELTGSGTHSDASREESLEPGSLSYDGEDGEYDEDGSLAPLEGPDGEHDFIHPLREAANRVGREVERFAEALDGYNPIQVHDDLDRFDAAFDLVQMYHNIAIDTVDRLREEHESECRREDGTNWRRKMKGFKISQDPEVMDLDEEDENEALTFNTSTTIDDLRRWQEEAQTWDLLQRMLKLEYSSSIPEQSTRNTPGPIHRYSSEKQVWDSFLKADSLALERHTVLRWLKQSATDSGDDIDVLVHELQQNAERGDILAHGWLHTKAAIKNQKRLHVWPQALDPASPDVQRVHLNSSKTEPLVTQLDPDALTRQDRKLEAQDQYFERAIWLGCYEMLRRGKSAKDIMEWCVDRTEIWRAVSMCGPLDIDGDEQETTLDSTHSILWRRMCFKLARSGGSDEYERAVYGVLSGDIQTVERVSRNWDDHLFAHYNALLRSQFETYVQLNHPSRAPADVLQSFGIFDAVQIHGEPQNASERLILKLRNAPALKNETRRPMKMLQGVLVAKQFRRFIYHQGLAISKEANAESPSNVIPMLNLDPENENTTNYISVGDQDSLRVLAHILIVYKSLGLPFDGPIELLAIENAIVAYISFLRLAGKEEFIPLYASQLSNDRLYATLSRELVDITDAPERKLQIKLMRDLGLDVQKFVRFQTRFLLNDFPDESTDYLAETNFSLLEDNVLKKDEEPRPGEQTKKIRLNFLGNGIDRVDNLLIRSLEWYLLVGGLWSETFRTGTLLYKRFYKNLNLRAAQRLRLRLSSDQISKNKTPSILGDEYDISGLQNRSDDEDITEQFDGSSEQIRLLRRHMAAEAKSFSELELLIEALDLIDEIGGCMAALRSVTKESDQKALKDTRITMYQRLQGLKPKMRKILQDWLLTSQQEEPEFVQLREAYLPELILAYDTALHFCGAHLSRDNFLECMELSTVIAAEDSDLAELFVRKGRMQELVTAFAENSKGLLASNAPTKGKVGGTNKKLRALGWTRELWDIKS